MPKILQINSVLNTGSTGRIVEQIGQYIISKQWDSYVGFGRSLTTSSSKTITIGNKFDQIIHGVKTRIFDKHGFGSVKATKLLIQQINNLSPDLIHLHNIHGYYLNYQILFKFLINSNIPVIWTLHDCWAFTGHCSYFSDINCLKWKVHCKKCPKTRNYPSSILMDNSYKNYETKKEVFNKLSNVHIVAVSQWLASLVKDSFLSSFPLKVIHNGINLDEFYPSERSAILDAKYGFLNRKVLIAVATSWSKNKGWNDYIELSKVLPNQFVIVLVGVTKKQKSTLPPQIIGIERTDDTKELAALYSHAEIVLNLSYQETFGMSTAEGLACGTPIIVYNTTASPELVTKNTGIIVETGKINKVLDAIKLICSKSKEFYTYECRQLALDRYNKEDRYADYFELYKSLLIVK